MVDAELVNRIVDHVVAALRGAEHGRHARRRLAGALGAVDCEQSPSLDHSVRLRGSHHVAGTATQLKVGTLAADEVDHDELFLGLVVGVRVHRSPLLAAVATANTDAGAQDREGPGKGTCPFTPGVLTASRTHLTSHHVEDKSLSLSFSQLLSLPFLNFTVKRRETPGNRSSSREAKFFMVGVVFC